MADRGSAAQRVVALLGFIWFLSNVRAVVTAGGPLFVGRAEK